MSDTPRTDANSGWCVGMYGIIRSSELFIDQDGPYVDVRFARQLERENAALRSLLREAVTDYELIGGVVDGVETEDYIARVKAALGEGKP